jgi:hypothetical protein
VDINYKQERKFGGLHITESTKLGVKIKQLRSEHGESYYIIQSLKGTVN